jgi:hypothetical protein
LEIAAVLDPNTPTAESIIQQATAGDGVAVVDKQRIRVALDAPTSHQALGLAAGIEAHAEDPSSTAHRHEFLQLGVKAQGVSLSDQLVHPVRRVLSMGAPAW